MGGCAVRAGGRTTRFFANSAGISTLSSAGGTAAPITKPDASKGERHLLPQSLPGGRRCLFTAMIGSDWETANIVLQSLDTGERRVSFQVAPTPLCRHGAPPLHEDRHVDGRAFRRPVASGDRRAGGPD